MAEQRVAIYGQKRIPIPDGMTQEQVKSQMARFFPELADPKVESKKDGDKVEWVFSKKAGTKGVGKGATGGGVDKTIESVEVDGQRTTYTIERSGNSGTRARGVFQLHGRRHETRWVGSQRFVASEVTKLVGQLNVRAAAEAAERERMAAWNAGQPKRVTDGQKRKESPED